MNKGSDNYLRRGKIQKKRGNKLDSFVGLFTGGSRSNKEKERLHSINDDYGDDDDDSHDSSAYSEFAISKRENTPRSTNNRKNKKYNKKQKIKEHTKRRYKNKKKYYDTSSDENESSSWISSNEESEYEYKTKHKKIKEKRLRSKMKQQQQHVILASSLPLEKDDLIESSFEILSQDELFKLTSNELRRRCKRLGLLGKNEVVEKSKLVAMLHTYYQFSAMGGTVSDNNNLQQQHQNYGSSSMYQHEKNTFATTTANDDSEQTLDILHEMIPIYGKGDPSIDKLVKETIERLPKQYLEMTDVMGNTILMLSCQSSVFELIPILLAKGSDPNARNNDGATCLHFACYSDTFSPETVKVLINNGAIAEIKEDRFGCTPLHWAASIGSVHVCEFLCNAGAISTTLDNNCCDPISYSKQAKNKECIDYLNSVSGLNYLSKDPTNATGVSTWEKLTDNQTGYTYFHDRSTGKSLWETDFLEQERVENLNVQNFPITRGSPPTGNISQMLLNCVPPNEEINNERALNVPSDSDEVFEINHKVKSPMEKSDVPFHGLKKDLNSEEANSKGNEKNKLSNSLQQPNKSTFTDDKIKPLSQINLDNGTKNNGPKQIHELFSDSSSLSSTYSTDHEQEHPKLLSELLQVKEGTAMKMNNSVDDASERSLIRSSTSLSPKKINLSPKKINTVSTDTFEERLAALQSKMEDQFVNQLKKIEEKVENAKKNSEKNSDFSSQSKLSLEKMSSVVVQLQSNIASKDLEIISLNREVVGLEGKLVGKSSNIKSKIEVKDAMNGDNDVTEEFLSRTDVENVKKELKAKNEKLSEMKEQCEKLHRKCNATAQEMSLLELKKQQSEKQVLAAEELVNIEKSAKEEVMNILENAQEGIEVDAQVVRSLTEDKQKVEDRIKLLLDEAKKQGNKAMAEITLLSNQLETKRKDLLTEHSKAENYLNQIENLKEDHEQKIQKIIKENTNGTESIQNNLIKMHRSEKKIIENQLREERLKKLEKEAQRNEAVQAMELAINRTEVAELKSKEMSDMLNEAKTLVGANEKLHRTLQLETDRRKVLHNKLEDLKGRIRVYVRIRCLDDNEKSRNCKTVLEREDKRTCVLSSRNERGSDVKSWEFDQIFGGSAQSNSTQEDIFRDTRLLITSAVDGFNVCIFAYGQTGSGKTYTMFGPDGGVSCVGKSTYEDSQSGLAPRIAVELFTVLGEREASHHIGVTVNMFELYNDGLNDLLNSNRCKDDEPLRIKLAEHSESGMVEVEGATSEKVESASDLLYLFRRGTECRTTASTQMNLDSSRSHLVTSMVTQIVNKRTGRKTLGKLTLVDLAGSERISKSGATGPRLKEAQSINKSLSALGDVINALTSRSKHIPYRNHPLTMLMSDSLGGNSKTLMLVCCSPADYNSSETNNSLDFAKRCKNVTNNVNNEKKSSSQIQALKLELARMKKDKPGNFKISAKNRAMRRPGTNVI